MTTSLRDIRAERARRHLADFVRQGWSVLEPGCKLEWNWHHDAICLHTEALFRGWLEARAGRPEKQPFQNLLITIPPGTAKSRITSVFAPAWMWLHEPSWRAVYLSANPRVALRDSMFCRMLLESEWYRETFQIQWQLADDQNAKSLYYTSAGGSRGAFGMSAGITGDRADHLGVDDPNDAFKVQSRASRDAINEKWDTATANRVNDLRISTRLGIMQRLHEDDWAGHVLARGGWEHLCLPLEYEPSRHDPRDKHHIPKTTAIGWSDPRKEAGEVLHPARFTPEVIAAEKTRLGPGGTAGQLQQRPGPAEGGQFKKAWWRFWKPDGKAPDVTGRPRECFDGPAAPLPALDRAIISVDAAFKDAATLSYVVAQVWGTQGANRYLLEQVRAHMGFKRTRETIRDLVARYPRATYKLIEDKANGSAIIDELKTEISGIVAVQPDGGKESRASAIEAQIASGNVYLPDGAPWLEDFVEEFGVFPNGTHDDQVDAASQALRYLSTGGSMARSIGSVKL